MSGKRHRTCQWEASTISGESLSWLCLLSASNMSAPSRASPYWKFHLCTAYLSHSVKVHLSS